MLKRKIEILLLIFALASFAGCREWGVRGNGKLQTVERKVPEFNRVEVSGVFYVKIILGNRNAVKIRAESNLLKYIETEVYHNTLEISSSRHLAPRKKLLIIVETKELKELESSGVNKIVVVNLNSRSLDVDCSGASEIKLKGKVEKLFADVSGASSLNACKLKADYVDVSVSGASSAYVYARKYLSADASGVSTIKYRGNPKKIETDVSGVSSIAKN